MTKARKFRWEGEGHVTGIIENKCTQGFGTNILRKNLLAKSRRRWKDNIGRILEK